MANQLVTLRNVEKQFHRGSEDINVMKGASSCLTCVRL